MKFITFVILESFVAVLWLFVFTNNVMAILLVILCVSAWFGYFSKYYRKSQKITKKMLSFSFLVGFLFMVIGGSFTASMKDTTNFLYQPVIIMSFLSLFVNLFCFFVIKFNLKISKGSREMENVSVYDKDINPATGLPMINGMDSAGNPCGSDFSRHNQDNMSWEQQK
ncbi:hypothetical protein ABK654_17850 [Morganella morganii]|uniref:hypothetical protein n=1 Tax=Morganella morganii TaxID=582 RepID=UPI003752E748